jgi:hypothetical protein
MAVLFIEELEKLEPFSERFLAALDGAYGFDSSSNAEIRGSWYELALRSGKVYAPSAAKWVTDKVCFGCVRQRWRLIRSRRAA